MKKKLLLVFLILILFCAGFLFIRQKEKQWFTLENIRYDSTSRTLSGECVEGSYLGEMIVVLPFFVSDAKLEDGQTVRVKGGPAMTMSLPPQLTGVSRLEILSDKN